jgi:glucosamine 6-phosphate synthetase-like amidotransferase/phosphosugar isomerase protein
MGRVLGAVEQVSGASALTVMGLWPRNRQLVAIRRGNPLHIAEVEVGYYMASLAAGLPLPMDQIMVFKDGSAVRFTQRGAVVDIETDTVRPAVVVAEVKKPVRELRTELDPVAGMQSNAELFDDDDWWKDQPGSRSKPLRGELREKAKGKPAINADGTPTEDYRGG